MSYHINNIPGSTTPNEAASAHQKDPETIKLLEKLKGGDHEAYKTIYLQWRKPIHSLLQKLTGSRQEADDITQDIFVNVWEKREKIDTSRNIKSLIFLVARQSSIKYLRKMQSQANYVNTAEDYFNNPDTPYEVVVQKELELVCAIVLEKMPKQQRKIYEMNANEGLSVQEIADKLDITRETVYNQLSKARKQMREALKLALLLLFGIC